MHELHLLPEFEADVAYSLYHYSMFDYQIIDGLTTERYYEKEKYEISFPP
jgi:hypothetical protein